MKITIQTDDQIKETNVTIVCNALTPEVEKVISMLRMLDLKLTGQKDKETYILDIAEILYIESVDKKTFLYTQQAVYESNLRLYELETELEKANFFRGSKSSIINIRQITSLKTELDGRIKVKVSNGEKLMVSRQYAPNLKKRLGVK